MPIKRLIEEDKCEKQTICENGTQSQTSLIQNVTAIWRRTVGCHKNLWQFLIVKK